MPEFAFKSDLHTHSTESDGVLTPAELVSEAARLGVSVIALTDHDTLSGLPEAISAGESLGITVIPGVELSAEAGPNEIHILGYFVDYANQFLVETLSRFGCERFARIERIVIRLQKLGLPVQMERVIEIAGQGTIGRPHVARALIELGYVDSIGDAFERFLGNGRAAFVPRQQVPAVQLVRLLRDSGAIPVLAHPLSTGDITATLLELIPAGLLGLETYYGEYSPDTRDQLRAIAESANLIPTGGSDFHGVGFKEGRDLGSAPVPPECVERLRKSWETQQERSS